MIKSALAVSVSAAALLFATAAFSDGGPIPEPMPEPAPMPEPSPEPEPVVEPAPEYDWYTTIFAGAAFGDLDETFTLDIIQQSIENTVTLPLDTGYLLGWTLGYDNLFEGQSIRVRPEAELSFRQQDVDLAEFEGGNVENLGLSIPADVLSLLGNVWVDFDLGGMTLYGGGGVGIGWADLPANLIPFHVEDSGLVWQAGGGLNFDINQRVFLGVGYRYFSGDFGTDYNGGIPIDFEVILSNSDFDYRAHEVLGNLGVRF